MTYTFPSTTAVRNPRRSVSMSRVLDQVLIRVVNFNDFMVFLTANLAPTVSTEYIDVASKNCSLCSDAWGWYVRTTALQRSAMSINKGNLR